MEGADEIEIGEVDCATDKPVCSKVDIHSYPTFKLFYNGEEFTKYQGNGSFCSFARTVCFFFFFCHLFALADPQIYDVKHENLPQMLSLGFDQLGMDVYYVIVYSKPNFELHDYHSGIP